MTSTDAKLPIPVTPLIRLYRLLRAADEAATLRIAARLARCDANEVASATRDSVRCFRSYNNVGEHFSVTKRIPPRPAEICNQDTLAGAVAGTTVTVDGPASFEMSYVAREVYVARTTARSPTMLNAFADEARSTATMKVDFLFCHEDGTPVVIEAKVIAKTFDTNSVLALVQALAGATQLATPSQRERLLRHYPQAGFELEGPVDVAVLTFEGSTLPNASNQAQLTRFARVLAKRVRASPDWPSELRNLYFITATGTPTNLACVRTL